METGTSCFELVQWQATLAVISYRKGYKAKEHSLSDYSLFIRCNWRALFEVVVIYINLKTEVVIVNMNLKADLVNWPKHFVFCTVNVIKEIIALKIFNKYYCNCKTLICPKNIAFKKNKSILKMVNFAIYSTKKLIKELPVASRFLNCYFISS